MKNEQLLNILLELGLSHNEAKVYLAALSLGPTTVLKIASLSAIKRSSVYPVMENLREKGLMSLEVKGFKKMYVAESPEKLELILEERKTKFKNALPDFSKLYNLQGEHDVIKRYDGLTAVKNVYETILKKIKPHDDYLIIADQSKWMTADEKYFMDFTERRSKLPIKIRMLQVDTSISRQYKKFEKNFNYKMKFLPKGSEFNTNLVITPQMLVIHQLSAPIMALIIENKNIIHLHSQIFESLWNSATE